MKKTIYRLSVVAAALAAVLLTAQCAKEIDPAAESKSQDSIGDGIEVTLTATKGEGTRTELTASGAEMTVTWSAGDKIYVVGETDGLRGYLTLSSGAGSSSATFKGCIKYLTVKQNVRFYYAGKDNKITGDTFTLDISSQNGTLDGIESTMHLMCGTLSNVSPSTISFGSVTMSNLISIVKVDTGTAFGEVSDITLGGTVSSASVNLKTGALTPTMGSISLTGTVSTDCYIALVQKDEKQYFSFSKDGKAAYLAAKVIVAGRYYSDSGSSLALNEEGYVEDGWNYGPGILVAGAIWAPVNCGIGYNFEHPKGLLYQWGRKYGQATDGETGAPTGDDLVSLTEGLTTHPDETTANKGRFYYNLTNWYQGGGSGAPAADELWKENGSTEYNPCPDGWKVPTKSQYEALVSLTRTWTTTGGSKSDQTGYLFGTSPTQVFLPVAGYRHYTDGKMVSTSDYGCYWSSSKGTSDIRFIDFTNSKVWYTNEGNRANGRSVRCVKDQGSVLLSGEFSVSATKKVNFTKGNLYYSTTDSKYHIEDQQNVTYATLGQSTYDPTHICHFYWSNITDWKTTDKEPWAQNYAYSAQSTSDKFFCGIDNPMEVDGQSGLYALTGGSSGEWNYLINSRANASSLHKYGVSVTTSAGTVNNCLVIAPDDWDYTNKPLQTSYDASAWATAEADGLVCLPAAGNRNDCNPDYNGIYGYYYSATPYEENDQACYLLICSDRVNPADHGYRLYARSVRLVRDAN